MQQPTALFFDLDNTLIDDDVAVVRAITQACDALRPSLPDIDAGLTMRAYLSESDAAWNSGAVNASNVQDVRLACWRSALALGGCVDEMLITFARDSYLSYRIENPVLYEDSLPVLDALHGRYRLAVITNGMLDIQRGKLDDTGLGRYFELVVTSDAFERGKPHPAMFRHAVDALSLDTDSVWHIGDGILTDVAGAHASGLSSVWLNRNGATREPHHETPHAEIAALPELLALLEAAL